MLSNPQEQGIYRKSVKSGTWYLLNIVAQKAINFLTFLALARLLDPRHYGVIGVVLLIQGFFDQLTNPSLGQALTREKDSVEKYLDPSWTFEILRYSMIALALFFSAGWLGNFFHFEAAETTLLKWSGAFLIIGALSNVRQLYFFKDLRFDKVFVRDVVVQIAFAITSISYAFFVEASVWALFAGYMATYVASVIISYVLYPSRPALSFGFSCLRDLVGYSKWVYGQHLLEVILAQLDKVIVGRLLEPASLGIYAKSKDLASMPTAIISSIIGKVGFSAFAKVQDKMEKVRQGFIKSVDIVVLGCLPLTLLLVFEGGAIVSLLLGSKWLGLVVPLKIFAFGNIFLAFVRIVNPLLAALGRPDVNFKTSAIQAIVSIPLMVLGFHYFGLNGLAVAVVATWIFLLAYVILKARPVLNIAVSAFVPAIVSGGLASMAMLLIDLAGRSIAHRLASPLITVAWLAVLGLTYFVCLLLVSRRFSSGPWQTAVSVFQTLRRVNQN